MLSTMLSLMFLLLLASDSSVAVVIAVDSLAVGFPAVARFAEVSPRIFDILFVVQWLSEYRNIGIISKVSASGNG
jgi:hypothetical protein